MENKLNELRRDRTRRECKGLFNWHKWVEVPSTNIGEEKFRYCKKCLRVESELLFYTSNPETGFYWEKVSEAKKSAFLARCTVRDNQIVEGENAPQKAVDEEMPTQTCPRKIYPDVKTEDRVYVVAAHGAINIGITNNIERKMAELQPGNPSELTKAAFVLVKNPKALVDTIFDRYKHKKRMPGWLELKTMEIVDVLETLNKHAIAPQQ
jgi:hypothetical protein